MVIATKEVELGSLPLVSGGQNGGPQNSQSAYFLSSAEVPSDLKQQICEESRSGHLDPPLSFRCLQPDTEGSEINDDNAPSGLENKVSNFVIDALCVVEPTLASVSNCGISFQNQFGSDPQHIVLCLRSMTDFYLTVDPSSRLNTFYVLNDLIQRDPRFRQGVLTVVLPRIYWVVSCLSDKDPYLKTIAVWEERKIYPPEVCTTIMQAFRASEIASKNAEEFESRLVSFTEMARIRAAKDIDLENLLKTGDTPDVAAERTAVNAGTAAAIMAASPSELRLIGITARSSLVVTQGTMEYLSRLLIDFDDGLWTSNLKSIEALVNILELTGAR